MHLKLLTQLPNIFRCHNLFPFHYFSSEEDRYISLEILETLCVFGNEFGSVFANVYVKIQVRGTKGFLKNQWWLNLDINNRKDFFIIKFKHLQMKFLALTANSSLSVVSIYSIINSSQQFSSLTWSESHALLESYWLGHLTALSLGPHGSIKSMIPPVMNLGGSDETHFMTRWAWSSIQST